MSDSAAHKADWFSKPGDTIKSLMQTRRMGPNELAARIPGGLSKLRGLLEGTDGVDRPTAIALAKHLGGSQQFWLKRQENYEAALSRAVKRAYETEADEWLNKIREAVLTAYDGRCAISRLPERRLLDAAHIIADGDELRGQPLVANGLPLSKIHHAAFDANLIGIDPDYRIHVSDELFAMNDGPMLEQGIKAMRGKTLLMPKRTVDRPDRDRLAARFELYRAAT